MTEDPCFDKDGAYFPPMQNCSYSGISKYTGLSQSNQPVTGSEVNDNKTCSSKSRQTFKCPKTYGIKGDNFFRDIVYF